MGLETGTYINSLNASNPVGTDAKSAGDDHIRLVKSTIKNTFPNVAGAVTPTHTELNYVDGVTSAIQTQLDAKQTTNANLTAEAGLTGAADKLAYYTGVGAKALTDFLAWGRTFLAAANVADARTALGAQETLVSGTNIKTVDGQSLLGSGNIAVAADGAFRSMQVYTTAGTATWTKPAGLKRIKVTVVGGGAGGSGGQVGGGSSSKSGGGGGAAIEVIEAASLGATETVTVGAGGAGGGTTAHGGAGGTSSFGTTAFLSATGGAGSSTQTPGVGSGGTINVTGGRGFFVHGDSNSLRGELGGSSILGGAGFGDNYVNGTAAPANSGGGGGGGYFQSYEGETSSGSGGAGGSGIVIVEEFF